MPKTTGFCLLTTLCCCLLSVAAQAQSNPEPSELEKLRQQVDELNNLAVRTQSHIMMDVEYQFANLWFAAKHDQWDLAAFLLRETQSHLAWTVRVRPVRNIAGGGTVDLKPFQQSIEMAGFAPLKAAIESKDHDAFTGAYNQTLPLCHSCHTASGLGYLEPHIPLSPPSALMIQGE